MKLSTSSLLHSFYKTNALTASIRRALIFSTIMLPVNIAVADIVIDDDNIGGGGTNTIIAPNPYTAAADITDTSGVAIRINDTNGANGLLTVNGGVTVSSSSAEAVILDGGGTTSVSITNAGTLSSVLNGLLVQNAAELTAFDNTGGIIESTGAASAGLYLQEDQDNAITNAGIIRNISSGDGLKLDTEAQTQDFINSGTISSATGIAINADTAMTGVFDNSGTITGGGGTAIDAEAAFNLTNSGTITGNIDHATAGSLTLKNSAGSIVGNITSTADAAHSLTLTGGSITGNITLNGVTANTFLLNGTTINGSGNVDLGDGAANSVTLTTGSISGSLDIGANTTAVSINTGGGDFVTVTTFDSLNATVNMTGAGTFNSTTFDNNSTVNQSAGIANITTLNIGANDTFNQSGTAVINSTTMNIGAGASFVQTGNGQLNATTTIIDFGGSLTIANQGTGIIEGKTDDKGSVVFSGNYNTDAALGTLGKALTSVTVNAGQVLTLDQDSYVTTFNDNGTVNQSAGTLTAATLNIGDNDTYTQTGTGVLNTTTTNLGNGATLTLLNQGTGIIQGAADGQGDVIFSGSYNTDAALGIPNKALASVTINVGQVLTLDQNSDVTTFNNNGTVNQSAGTLTAATLNIGDNDTYTQTGTGVLNTTTTNVGNGATLTLLNQGTGIIRGAADGQGDVVFSGSYNTDAALGESLRTLASITVNAGQILSLDQDGDVTTLNNNGTVNQSAGTLTATTLNIGDNDTYTQTGTGVLNTTTTNLGNGATLTLLNQGTGIIRGAADGQGDVVFSGSYNTDAVVGTTANSLASITVNAGQTLTLDQNADVTTLNNNGIVNQTAGSLVVSTVNNTGSFSGFVGTSFDADAAFTLNNSGTVTGNIDHATAGALIVNQTAGSIVGNIVSTADAAHNLSFTGGSVTGDITLNGSTANTFLLNGSTINGNVDLGDGAANSVTLTTGSLLGLLDVGNDTTAVSINTGGGASVTVTTLNTNTAIVAMTGVGTLNSTTFNANGNVNQSAGTANITTLNIGDNNAYTQTGNGVLNTTTTNIGAGGTLTLLNQGTGSINGTADNQGALVFSGSYNTDAELGTASNSLSSITVNSGQTLTLDQNSDATSVVIAGILNKSSTSTMTGNTTINDGATMNIANNFTHTGNLTVGQSASGVVSVDEGITTAVIGNYTQTANGIFQLGASSNSNYGQMTVTGTATLASNAKFDVDVNGVNTLIVGQTLPSVVSAGTLISDVTFQVTDNSSLFNFTGARVGNAIDIYVISAESVLSIVERIGSPAAVGAAAVFDDWLLNGGDTPEIGDIRIVFGQLVTDQEKADAVESSIPGLSAGVAQATSSSIKGLTKMINSRQDYLRGLSSGDNLIANKNFWIAPYGSWTDQDDRQGVSGYSIDSYGLAMGMDADVSSGFNLGVSAAYTRSDVDSKLAAGEHNIDVDSYQAKLYATAMLGEFTALNLQLGGGVSDYDSQRKVFTLDVADVDYDSWHAQFNAELEHSIFLKNNVVLTPYIFADYSYVDVEEYEEKGAAALNLTVDGDSDETLIVGLGSKADYFATEDLVLLADLSVGYDFMARRSKLTSAFEGGGGQFSTVGIKPDEFVYTAGLGFIYSLDNGSEITGRYDFYGREDYTDQAVSIRLSMLF